MKTNKKIGIIGHGVVGSAYHQLFPEALVYDINGRFQTKEEINQNCEIALVCVPTPMRDGGLPDIIAVESSIDWLKVPLIVIKSTVPAGTTERLRKKTGKTIIFNPEFLRAASPVQDLLVEKNIIIGGEREEAGDLVAVYKDAYSHDLNFYFTTPTQAELIKYMRNVFLATKVTFLNEMKAIADQVGVDFSQIRDLWVLDERMGPSHNEVTQEGGFGGMCLPKDINALIHFAQEIGYDPKFIKEVWNANTRFNKSFKDAHKY